MLSEKQGHRGYVFSRAMGGNVVPQRVQNTIIRDYARRRDLLYLLSATEYGMDGCFMMLHTLLAHLDTVAGFIFYSTHQLPPVQTECDAVCRRILAEGCDLHFALENLVVEREQDIALLHDIRMVRALAHPLHGSLVGVHPETLNLC